MLRALILGLFLAAACRAARADTAAETYTVYIRFSPTLYAYATYTDLDGFIDTDLWVGCAQLSSYRFIYNHRAHPCGAGEYSGLYFAPTEGGLSVQIGSERKEYVIGGFFVPPDTDGTFLIQPNNPSYLKISDPPARVVAAEPGSIILVVAGALGMLLKKKSLARIAAAQIQH